MSKQRILALVIRHLYIWPRSLERLMWSFGWPFIDLIIWGVTMSYIQQTSNANFSIINVFLGATILWTILWRTQNEMAISLLDEAWNKNLINVFSSPITITEFLVSTIILNFIKISITIVSLTVAAWLFYHFNVISLFGFFIPIILLNLFILGWSFGLLVLGLVLRYGYTVAELAWALVAFIQPFSCVFYPLSALPSWAQKVAQFIPSYYVFEEMRNILINKQINITNIWTAFILNIIYLLITLWFFYRMFEKAREHGRLVKLN